MSRRLGPEAGCSIRSPLYVLEGSPSARGGRITLRVREMGLIFRPIVAEPGIAGQLALEIRETASLRLLVRVFGLDKSQTVLAA